MARFKIKIGKYGKIHWSKPMIKFVQQNYQTFTNRELADALGLNLTSVRTKCYELGLQRMQLEYWTVDQVNFLLAYYQILGDVEIAHIFNQIYPKNKPWTNKHIDKKRGYLQLNRSKSEYKKIVRRNAEQGKYTTVHQRWENEEMEQGKVRVWRMETHSAVMVKWSGGNYPGGYIKLAHLNWLLFNGTPIGRKMKIIHKDGDTMNCDIENLERVTSAELQRRTTKKHSQGLSDNYIRGILTHKNEALRKHIPAELIELKRNQLLLNRSIRNEQTR